ncbi:MAG: hypothetical protein AAGU05_00365, partial [Anaerolineaceae bacterium]
MIHKSILAAGLLIAVLIFTGCTAPGFNGTGVLSTVEIATAQPISATLPAEPTQEFTAQASAQPETISSVAYIGEDGNVWLLDRAGGGAQQITTDAVLMTAGSTAEPIRYCCLGWSSDGLLLSYMREESVAVEGAYNYVYTFTVFDTAAHTGRAVLEGQPTVGYAWKPGSHLIAYGQPVDMRYWTSREAVPSQYAQGIWQLDAETGETVELAPAERGYTLVMPVWSGDGRYLAFEEIRLMEGRGDFAFFDLETGRYHALERVLGSYTWSPDGSRLAYDQIGYIPMGGERIWINTPDGGQESPFSPLFDEAWYAFAPSF